MPDEYGQNRRYSRYLRGFQASYGRYARKRFQSVSCTLMVATSSGRRHRPAWVQFQVITAAVTFASYISSLLRNARGFAPTTFSIPATPSSRRRFQMSETATISKLRSLPTLPNAGRRAWRKRSENPTIPTRTRSFAPRIFAYRAAGSAAAVAAATFTNSRRGIFVLCSDISPPGSRMGATAGGVEPGQRAAHIGERLFHPRQRVVDV